MTAPAVAARDAWTLAKLLFGGDVNGELAELPSSIRPAADYLASLAPEARQPAWQAMTAALGPMGSSLAHVVATCNPTGPRPEAEATETEAPIRCATVADLARVEAESRFAWKGWIIRGHLTLLSSEVKVGKTRLAMSLARRLWFGEPWPDGQAATFPPETRTLWIPGDCHHSELADLTTEFGLPTTAVLFNADPDTPYGGWDLDDSENVEGLRRRIDTFRPGLVFIDTVWKTTRANLCSMKDVNTIIDPIVTIAQETDTAIVGMMHLSAGGETLGRRLDGIARAIIKMDRPDPEGSPDRRKLWVDRANFKGAPPLGVKVKDGPCDFDHTPPSMPAPAGPARRGPKPERQAECEAWLTERLRGVPSRVSVVRKEAEAEPRKYGASTIYAARDALGIEEYEVDGKKWWKLPIEVADRGLEAPCP